MYYQTPNYGYYQPYNYCCQTNNGNRRNGYGYALILVLFILLIIIGAAKW